MLDWRPITTSRDPRYMVKGTELAMTYVEGCGCRFAIYEVRCYDAQGQSDVLYRIRDAEKVSDAQVREGVRPQVVGETHDLDRAVDWVRREMT